MNDIIEQLFYSLYEDDPDPPEQSFYWDKLFESVEAMADSKYDKRDVGAHLYDIVAPYGSACKMQGWKSGISFMLQLFVECQHTPDKTRADAEAEYMRKSKTNRLDLI